MSRKATRGARSQSRLDVFRAEIPARVEANKAHRGALFDELQFEQKSYKRRTVVADSVD